MKMEVWLLELFELTMMMLIPDTDRQIPAILSYVDGEEYYGQQAKQQLVRNSKNTVAYFRDFLGQEYGCIISKHIVNCPDIQMQLQVDRSYSLPRLGASSRTRSHGHLHDSG